jgi:hypothetical protein
MASGSHNNRPPLSDDPIPLQDLSSSASAVEEGGAGGAGSHLTSDFAADHRRNDPGHRSLLRSTSNFGAELGRRISIHLQRPSYERLSQEVQRDPTPPTPQLSVQDLQLPEYTDDEGDVPAPSRLREEIHTALGTMGSSSDRTRGSWLPPRNLNDPVQRDRAPRWSAGSEDGYGDDNNGYASSLAEDDSAPLAENQAPIAGAAGKRLSVQSVRFAPGSSLGDDLNIAEEGLHRTFSKTSGRSGTGSTAKSAVSRQSSFSKAARSLSPGHSPVRRVSVAVQNMAQRVVNVSNDSQALEETIRRRVSSKSTKSNRPSVPDIEIHPYDSEEQEKPTTPLRKPSGRDKRPWREQANPLKGNTLRIFSPTSRVRLILCDVLIHP